VGEVTNVGVGKGISIGELAKRILVIAQRADLPIATDEHRVRPEKSEVMELICDATKAGERCGWKPKRTLEEGLAETVSFVRANLDLYRPEVYAL
jgi:dTDP-glucose 4,6-dehydratase